VPQRMKMQVRAPEAAKETTAIFGQRVGFERDA